MKFIEKLPIQTTLYSNTPYSHPIGYLMTKQKICPKTMTSREFKKVKQDDLERVENLQFKLAS